MARYRSRIEPGTDSESRNTGEETPVQSTDSDDNGAMVRPRFSAQPRRQDLRSRLRASSGMTARGDGCRGGDTSPSSFPDPPLPSYGSRRITESPDEAAPPPRSGAHAVGTPKAGLPSMGQPQATGLFASWHRPGGAALRWRRLQAGVLSFQPSEHTARACWNSDRCTLRWRGPGVIGDWCAGAADAEPSPPLLKRPCFGVRRAGEERCP